MCVCWCVRACVCVCVCIDYVTEEGLETHTDLNKAHACPGQQQVILFKLSSVFFFKAVFPSSDTV